MLYGQVHRLMPVLLWLLIFSLAPVSLSAPARPLPASDLAVTLLSAGPGALQVQGADGRAFAVRITPATWVLRRGLVAAPRDLAPGETLRVRLGRGKAGAVAALSVCDAETAAVLADARGRPLAGTILSAAGKVWTVQPNGGDVPLPVLLSPHTLFRVGGSLVAASAFGAGAAVTITTRGLANGLLAALSVSDAPPDGLGQMGDVPTARPVSVSGVVVEARPDLGLLTLQDAAGVSRTVAMDARTRVKTQGKVARLGDLLPGMRVRVHLGTGQDASGNPVATSVSASAGRPARKAKGR